MVENKSRSLLSNGKGIAKTTSTKEYVNLPLKNGRSLAYWIWRGESPKRGVNDYNRGSQKCRYSNKENINFTTMTIAKLKYYQSLPVCTKDVIFAAGWQQVIPTTLKYCQRVIGFKNTDLYNQYLQDKIFVDCLTKIKRPEIYGYVISGAGLKLAGRAVAREWASIASPIHCKIPKKGGGYKPWSYGAGCYNQGHGINHHSVHYDKVLKALQQARHNYIILRKKGVSKMKAYAYSIGIKDY